MIDVEKDKHNLSSSLMWGLRSRDMDTIPYEKGC